VESENIPTPLGVPSPFLIDFFLQYIASAGKMLDVDDEALSNSLLSVNLIHMISVLLRWEYTSLYKSKSVYSSLNSLLQKTRNAVVRSRQKFLNCAAYSSDEAVVGTPVNSSDENVCTVNTDIHVSGSNIGNTISQEQGEKRDTESAGGAKGPSGQGRDVPVDTLLTPKIENDTVLPRSGGKDTQGQGPGETDSTVAASDGDEGVEEEGEEDGQNYPFQLLLQLSCLISNFLGRTASALIEGNPNTTVRCHGYFLTL
jgi:hypothetical protein